MFKQLVVRRSSLLLGVVNSFSTRQSHFSRVQSFVETIAYLPCLQCGLQTSLSLSQSSDILVDCGKTKLPLSCSQECTKKINETQSDVLAMYDSMMEDVQYATTSTASKLFAEVLQSSRRESREWDDEWQVTSWTYYLKLYCPDEQWLEDLRALRLMSSAYSYVMTLSRFLPELVDTDNRQKVELHVIGARAEAMSPRYLWDELSFFYPRKQFDIKLVGDQVPIMSARKKTPTTKENELIRLEMIHGLYHKIGPRNLTTPDAFVLYNPGVGHPRLRENWKLTLQTVLASCKPLLITSFSLEDQQRDIAALQDLVASSPALKQHKLRFRCRPKQNSFCSLKYQVDPSNVGAPILTNNRVMVVQLVPITRQL
ncbi:hypothetical protein DD237_003029 [Peronospora effusa]|uniref:Mitochondrial splicing suppressor 51-like C-terminal domain-containing protein n=1 Tax=Peronospora effusa TaxID=542832 RepID=A0A3R8CWX8_9STRA|nr:hypothetical protein DD237_003029 [Peronospora effusa]